MQLRLDLAVARLAAHDLNLGAPRAEQPAGYMAEGSATHLHACAIFTVSHLIFVFVFHLFVLEFVAHEL